MAKSHTIGSESLDELLNCQVCFEDYQETGDHVPRILPCHHTLCHSCIERLIHRNRVQCPECRSKFDAKKGEINFLQNKYILILLKKKSSVLKEETTHFKKCAEHGKDEMFFCKEKSCQTSICPSCLSAKHLGHQVVEIQDTKQEVLEVLLKKVENISQILDQKIKKVTETQKDTIKKAQTNIDKLKKKKEEVMETFDQMIKEAEDQMLEMKKATNGEINAMKEKLNLLNSVKQSVEAENEDTLGKLDTVTDIEKEVRKIFSGMKKYNYSEYNEAQKLYVGDIVKKVITVDLSARVQGNLDINTQLTLVHHLVVLSDDTVVVCGDEGNKYRVKRYNLQTGRELTSIELQSSVEGMTEVELRGDPTLALACSRREEIEFRSIHDLNKVLHIHSVAPHKPGRLCQVAPSILLYENTSTEPREVCSLDCSGGEPIPAGSVVHTNITSDIEDICCTEYENEKLLIVADKDEMIHVYSTAAGELKWTVKEKPIREERKFKPRGVAADGRGHLFVSDEVNKCIQMFSVSDGQHLGHFRLEVEQSIGRIDWRDSTSSLLVAYNKDNEYCIRDFFVQ